MEDLTEEQREKIEANKAKALSKRKAAQTAQLIRNTVRLEKRIGPTIKGEGFFESNDEPEKVLKKLREEPQDSVHCLGCSKEFFESLAREKFDLEVCDECRKTNEKYRLVPRTEAKTLFKLKDCDIDLRPPPLRFYEKPNPHREHGAPMRLYIFCQLEERAKIVWGSLETLEKEKDKRHEDAKKRRKAGFNRKIKDLKREQRVLSYQVPGNHEHVYGEEQCADADNDQYFKECKTCGHKLTYEKL